MTELACYIIATGIDVTDASIWKKQFWRSAVREQRRIGQDLHDGLGQHLTGIAFMSKVQEQRLMEKSLPEAGDAAKIVKLVNEAIIRHANWLAVCCRWCPMRAD